MKVDIYPSILNADHDNMQHEFDLLCKPGGADGIHLDVMDGKFVDPVTFDIPTIERYVKMCDLPFDAHLMIVEPEKHVDKYIEAGVDSVTFHLETAADPAALIDHLHERGVKAGVSINPDKPGDWMIEHAGHADLFLFMSVFPGYGGQKFIPEVLDGVRKFKRHCADNGLNPVIQIDGGLNHETSPLAVAAGVNNIVAGTYITKSDDYVATMGKLRDSVADVKFNY